MIATNKRTNELTDGRNDEQKSPCVLQDFVLFGAAAKKTKQILETEAEALSNSRTAKFWLLYMRMIDILRRYLAYLRGECLGNWPLHLQATLEMLAFFAATGHYNYLKSSYVYLLEMMDLENSHPDIYFQFLNGLHVVRRSDREWAGLSSDYVIETCLMRNLKTAGGLTHGSGMTETQRNQWTLSMPVCAEVHNTIQEITTTNIRTGEQNKDFGPSRIDHDWKDTNLVRDFFKERNPFEYGPELCDIANGVHAHATVNVEDAEEIGKKNCIWNGRQKC